jgi:hypothetical protein
MPPARFVVARNPDPESSLPYLLRVPVDGGPVLLKAKDSWPRTAKVYCHEFDEWPPEAEILDEVPTRVCERRGRAIDLVLDRGREHRSQFVFASKNGRRLIFWQTARTAAASRPGVRLPTRRASGLVDLGIIVDTRERYPYRFVHQQATTRRAPLGCGDYGVEVDGEAIAVVERKSRDDAVKGLVDGRLGFAMAELATMPTAAVVVESSYARLLDHEYAKAGFVADLLAGLAVRYPSVPVIFAGSRKLAEEWTFRFLGAARAEAAGDRRYGHD